MPRRTFADLLTSFQNSFAVQDSTLWNITINAANKAVDRIGSKTNVHVSLLLTSCWCLNSEKVQRFYGWLCGTETCSMAPINVLDMIIYVSRLPFPRWHICFWVKHVCLELDPAKSRSRGRKSSSRDWVNCFKQRSPFKLAYHQIKNQILRNMLSKIVTILNFRSNHYSFYNLFDHVLVQHKIEH